MYTGGIKMSDYEVRKDLDKLREDLENIDSDLWQKILHPTIIETSDGSISEIKDNVYDKSEVYTAEEVDEKLKKTIDNLLNAAEDYLETSSDKYSLFRGDCWTINNNFECSAAITSESDTDFTVTGTFRTKQDLIGIYWNSKDLIQHEFISYGSRYDYSGVTLEFDYEMSGCTDFNSGMVSLTVNNRDGTVCYFTMSQFVDDGHVTIDFDELTGNDYDPTNIENIMLVLIPTSYTSSSTYTIMANVDFSLEVSNIEVTGGDIRNEHIQLEPHEYRLCEGYDDIYNFNPRRLVKEMRKLGYVDWVDLYIGASHFYEKSGTVDDVITHLDFDHLRTEKMVLDDTVPLNCAFEAWLDCYSRELKDNDVDNLIISVSMENLQCPTSWRQKTSDNDYAETMWVPSTFFYSPCNDDALDYMKSVSQACLDIIVDNGLNPILQLGEAWWWWNEPDEPDQPPCFYDSSTTSKYYAEFGENLPTYTSSWVENYDSDAIDWLNQQLVAYSDGLRTVVKSSDYDDGKYLALFFPPSVLDTERVPRMMQQANYLTGIYDPLKLDILELEDYDWVTGESSHHEEVYTMGQDLGFTLDNLHYYGGFVLNESDALKFWRLIKDAMETAISMKFSEVFVWAGSQVRRDRKIIGYDDHEFIQDLLRNAGGGSSCDCQGSGGVIAVGSFSINNQGHLIVELPDGVANPYYIDANGHLIYNTSAGGS